MTRPPEAQTQQNRADFWNERQEKVQTWKESAEVQWDLVRSLAAKASRKGDESVYERLSKLLNTFYVTNSQ